MGNELKKAACPSKYYSKGNLFAETLPTLVALILVAIFSGGLFQSSGMELVVTVVIEAAIFVILYGSVFLLFRGIKKRQAETYMSVCENGICGVCAQNGYKNRTFSLYYSQIDRVDAKGERLFVYAQKERIVMLLNDTDEVCSLIRSKLGQRDHTYNP